MSFMQPLMLIGLPLIALPIIIHLINQWRYQTKPWGAMVFLLQANRMNRGFAKLRQWMILAMRTLAVAGLIFTVARPLSSGLLGISGGGKTDTTIVLLDRSPSMQEQGPTGVSKLETARAQLGEALQKLGSEHWVAIDSADRTARSFDSLDALLDATSTQPCSASSDLPGMLQSALDYLQTNRPGPTEIWIASDLRETDWMSADGAWTVAREGFESIPQSVRFHLLAFPDSERANLSITVQEARRDPTPDDGQSPSLLLSLRIKQAGTTPSDRGRRVPVQIEIEGTRSELQVELTGPITNLRNQRVALPKNKESGWGKVTLPADSNLSDNEFYFVFSQRSARRSVIVSDDPTATKALEIAASLDAAGQQDSIVDVLSAEQIDSLALDDASLLIWQTTLPDDQTSKIVDNYLQRGGQVLFLPPTSLLNGSLVKGGPDDREFRGVRWAEWSQDNTATVENWRADQDLLATTLSGAGLPVGQLQFQGYGVLESTAQLTNLATLTGGVPLLAKLPTDFGGVYFLAASPHPDASSLAESGIVIFVAVQRALEQGQLALGQETQRTASANAKGTGQATANWRRLAGSQTDLSTEFEIQAGVYKDGDRVFAINRKIQEDEIATVDDSKIEELFSGLPFSRVDGSAGELSGIVREIWRLFLICMILAMLIEAALCLPRTGRSNRSSASSPLASGDWPSAKGGTTTA